MKFLKYIIFFILGCITLYLTVSYFMASEITIKKNININANPFFIFNQINDLEKWEAWDPWTKTDSTIRNNYSEVKYGFGSYRQWESQIIGNGRITITKSDLIKQINFTLKSNQIQIEGQFNFIPNENGVNVSWTNKCKIPFFIRIIGPFFKNKIGADLEKGLTEIKRSCEEISSKSGEIKIKNTKEQSYLYMIDSCQTDNLNKKINEIYLKIYKSLSLNNLETLNSPFIKFISFPKKPSDKNQIIFKAGFFTNEKIEPKNKILSSEINQKTIEIQHFGPHKTIRNTYKLIDNYCLQNNIYRSGEAYEVFMPDKKSKPEILIIYEIQE